MTVENIKAMESCFKQDGWKKLAGYYYLHINETTIAYILSPYLEEDLTRTLIQTANIELNETFWLISSLPSAARRTRDHLVDANRCTLNIGYESLEYSLKILRPQLTGRKR